ncbi:hypothetical protein ACJJTC_010207 [Scirpophaga incertulas]
MSYRPVFRKFYILGSSRILLSVVSSLVVPEEWHHRLSNLRRDSIRPGIYFLRRSQSLTMSNSSSDMGGTTTEPASGGASGGAFWGSNGPGSGNSVPTRSSSPQFIAEVEGAENLNFPLTTRYGRGSLYRVAMKASLDSSLALRILSD